MGETEENDSRRFTSCCSALHSHCSEHALQISTFLLFFIAKVEDGVSSLRSSPQQPVNGGMDLRESFFTSKSHASNAFTPLGAGRCGTPGEVRLFRCPWASIAKPGGHWLHFCKYGKVDVANGAF